MGPPPALSGHEAQVHQNLSHSLRAICTVLLDPRDSLLHSERTQGFAADPDYWKGEVFAYVGRNQNLKDLKRTATISCKPQGLKVSAYVESSKYLKDLTSSRTNRFSLQMSSVVHDVSSSLSVPVVLSFRAFSGRLKFTVRRHKFNEDSLFLLLKMA